MPTYNTIQTHSVALGATAVISIDTGTGRDDIDSSMGQLIDLKGTVCLDKNPLNGAILIGYKRIPNRGKFPRASRSCHALGDGRGKANGT